MKYLKVLGMFSLMFTLAFSTGCGQKIVIDSETLTEQESTVEATTVSTDESSTIDDAKEFETEIVEETKTEVTEEVETIEATNVTKEEDGTLVIKVDELSENQRARIMLDKAVNNLDNEKNIFAETILMDIKVNYYFDNVNHILSCYASDIFNFAVNVADKTCVYNTALYEDTSKIVKVSKNEELEDIAVNTLPAIVMSGDYRELLKYDCAFISETDKEMIVAINTTGFCAKYTIDKDTEKFKHVDYRFGETSLQFKFDFGDSLIEKYKVPEIQEER